MNERIYYWGVAAIAVCVAVYLNSSCDGQQACSRKPLACYFGE